MTVAEYIQNVQVQVFKYCTDYIPPVTTTKLCDIISRIRTGTTEQNPNLFKYIRTLSKGERDQYKKTTIPCYSPTFIYTGYRKKDNIKNTNNLIYLDIDKQGFDPDKHLDKSKIITYYHTLSGRGYAILVATDHTLSVQNFKSFYVSVVEQLNLQNYYDPIVNRHNVAMSVSYDPYLYLNESEIYKFTYVEKPKFVKKKKYTVNNTSVYQPPNSNSNSDTIRFNNCADLKGYNTDGILLSKKKDIPVVKVCHYKKIKAERSRNTILSVYANNLLWLNPSIEESHFRNQIHQCNINFFIDPLPTNQVNKMINHKLLTLKKGELIPVITNRKIVIHPNNGSRKGKNKIIRNIIAEKRKELSKEKLYRIIETWDFKKFGKISGRKIAQHHPISYKTVIKYYPIFKQYISSLNKSHNDISSNKL